MPFSRLLKFFTSLRLTVVLLACSIVLIFVGTLAQVDEGLYATQAHYFQAWIVTGLDLFGRKIPFIFPGGYIIGTLLLINLIAAHIYRFQFSAKKLGIQLAHAGIILILLGLLATDMLAHESQMHFYAGETRSYSESPQYYELVFETPASSNTEQVVSIPASLLARGGVIQHTNLPFAIRVKKYWKNSESDYRAPMMTNGPPLATNGVALNFDFHPADEVKTTDEKNVPTALIKLDSAGNSLGDWVVSDWTDDAAMIEAIRNNYAGIVGSQTAGEIVKDLTQPQSVFVDGKKYTFALQAERTRFPFSLTLLKATHTLYEGTETPKDFRSLVQLQNRHTGEDRQVEISMNHPLRYAGLTFYQYQMNASEAAVEAGQTPSSVLMIVHNPSWLTPYIGCGMVAAGLVVQFMFHLVGFITKKK